MIFLWVASARVARPILARVWSNRLLKTPYRQKAPAVLHLFFDSVAGELIGRLGR